MVLQKNRAGVLHTSLFSSLNGTENIEKLLLLLLLLFLHIIIGAFYNGADSSTVFAVFFLLNLVNLNARITRCVFKKLLSYLK